MRKYINSDCYRYYGDDNLKTRVWASIFQSGYRYTKLYRKAHFHKAKNNRIRYMLFRIRLLRASYKYGYQINENTKIGKGFYIGHRGMLIVNGETSIGNNVNIQSGVVIGQENRGKRKGVPTIGNKVWIGGNAVIVGKISIGNNVLIAPNSYVNFDVPDDSIVVGNPAKIIADKNATDGYIQNQIEE